MANNRLSGLLEAEKPNRLAGLIVEEEPARFDVPAVSDPQDVPVSNRLSGLLGKELDTGIKVLPEQFSKEKFPHGVLVAAPEKTFWQKTKGFFVGEPRYGRWTKPTRLDYLHRAIGVPVSILTKYSSGRTFGADKLLWYVLSKIRPDLANKPLEEQMRELNPIEQSGFNRRAGDVAEFIGQIQSATKALGGLGLKTRPGTKFVDRVANKAPPWMSSGAIEAIVDGITREKDAKQIAKDVATKSLIRGGEAIVWSGVEIGAGKLFGWAMNKFPRFRSGWGKWARGKPPEQTRSARAEVDAALRIYKETGDKTAWDNARIKFGGITPEGAQRIRARRLLPPAPSEISKLKITPAEKNLSKGLQKRANVSKKIADKAAEMVHRQGKSIAEVDRNFITPAVVLGEDAAMAAFEPSAIEPFTQVAKKIPVTKKPEITEPATSAQKAKAHIIAKEKAFVSEKGKLKPGYRALAKAMTGQNSIAKMTKQQASDFINALNRLPEPRMVRGKLVPPVIPTTTRLAVRGQFQQVFKEPTPISIITDPSFYANQLGVKSLVEPLEKAKQDFDFEYRNASNELDKQGVLIDKIGKTTIKERVTAKIKNIPTKAREEIGRLLDAHEVAPENLAPEKTRMFNYFRGLTRTMLQRQNEAREKLGWPTIPNRKAYMRRIATDISKEMLAGKYPFPEGVKFWSGINTGEKVFNPMEFRRKLEDDVFDLFVKDPVRASKAMMFTALKEIHLNQPLKFYKQQLNAIGKDMPEYRNLSPRERAELDRTMVIPASTRRWLTEYVNTSILGRQSKVDELVNNTVTKTGLKGVFDKFLAPFGRTVGRKPITDFFRNVGRMQMAGVLGPRPRLILRNKFQLTQNLALYTNKANVRAFGPNNKELNSLLEQSRFLRDYTGLEDLPVDIAGKIEKLWHSAFQWSAKSNARQAMEVAYWDTKELIDNPIYKKHGWKQEHLLKEMEFGASATQFHYTALGMPQIFRHKTLLPMTRLTSWWMNYFSKFHREAIHRAFTGRPSWAGSEGPTLPWSRRLGWMRYVVIGGAILNTMGYTRSFLFGAAPTGWPPAMQFSWNAYLYTVSQDEKQKAAAKKKMWQAGKTFIPGYIAFKDFEAIWSGRKDLSQLLFYKK